MVVPCIKLFVLLGSAVSVSADANAEGCQADVQAGSNRRALLQVSAVPEISVVPLGDTNLQPQAKLVSEAAQLLAVKRQGSSGVHGMVGGGGKKSIFTLKIADVDHYMFWKIVAGMLIFTIAVDRGQAGLDYLVQDSESGQMLLKRVNGEFCMFGVVAIGIFLGNNCVKIQSDTFSILEFVDIMCSLACCSLIGIVASLFLLHQRASKVWLKYDETTEAEAGKPEGKELGVAEYKVMARNFSKANKLPEGFLYSVYLKECFVRDCCEVMNIQWDTWLILTVLATAQFLNKYFFPREATISMYLWGTLAINAGIFAGYAGLAVHLQSAYSTFLQELVNGVEDTSAVSDSTDTLEHPMSEKWGGRVRWALQILSIVNTFMMSCFFMHDIHNISINNVSSIWYIVLVVPGLICVIFILPMVTNSLSIIEAYYGSNHDALDQVLSLLNILEEDMMYARMLWKCQGEPVPKELGEYDIDGFVVAMGKDFGLRMSEQRARRLFQCFDTDMSGSVSGSELLDGLRDTQKKSIKHAASILKGSSEN